MKKKKQRIKRKKVEEKKELIQLTDLQWRIVVAVEAAVLCILNFVRLFDNSFWGDEGFSIRLMKLGLGAMIKATAEDVHPPFYYMFAKIIYGLFGSHGWVFHLTAFIPYVLILIFSCTLIYNSFGKETAFLFNILASLLDHSKTYIMEVRMYELGALLMLISAYAFLCIMEDKESKKNYVIFVIASLGAAYTHYYCVISVAVFYLALIFLAVRKKLSWKKVILVCLITVIGYMPWFMTMLQTARQVTNDFWLKSAPRFLGSILYLFSADKLFYSFFMFVTTLVLSAAAFIRSKDNFRLLPLLLSSLVTIAFGLIISAVYRPVYLLRYLYPSAIVFCLALCIAVSKTKRKMEYTIILSAITLMVCIPAYINTVKTEKYKDLRCTEACQKVKENIHPGDVVLTNNTFIGWTIFEYYFPDLTCISDVSAGYSDFEEGKNYYLMWKNDISDDEKNWLSGYGFQPEKIMENGSVGETDFQLYRLNKQVQ